VFGSIDKLQAARRLDSCPVIELSDLNHTALKQAMGPIYGGQEDTIRLASMIACSAQEHLPWHRLAAFTAWSPIGSGREAEPRHQSKGRLFVA
jgi:hypothetical protein